jgi:2'-5' RNA ligase
LTADGTRRVFFALWPDAGLRRALVERRKAIDDLSRRRVPEANLHATLLFLGNQPGARVDRLVDALPAPGADPDVVGFTLRLDRFGWFARARVAWLGGPPVPAGRALVSFLGEAAQRLGADVDRRTWVPHVTLFRDVRRRPVLPVPDPLDWPVDRFSLVESIPGRPYQVLRTWPLQ